MSRKKTFNNTQGGLSEYQKGYLDGQHDTFEASELDAYFAGVGFGKREHGDKHLGFSSAKERYQFEKGIKEKDDHFNAYRAGRLSLWERLFGKTESKKLNYTGRRSARRTTKKVNKQHKKKARYTKRQNRRTKRYK